MTIVKRLSIAFLILSIAIVPILAACQDGGKPELVEPGNVETASPSAADDTGTEKPTQEPLALNLPDEISLPDEARPLFEAWRIVQREYVDIENVDPRVLSDGAIFGILDAIQDTSLSISQARALEFELELEENYFSVPGGEELEEAYEVLAYAYIQPTDSGLDLEDLNIAAIRGMVGALADPYTAYLSRDDLRLDQSDLEGSFHGIGAYVGTNSEGYPIIISPMENSPAEAAGILAGDIILEIDGVEANTISLQESILRIRGPEGTPVELLIKHLLTPEPERIVIVRGNIPIDSVFMESLDDDIYRIRINLFTRRTPIETEDLIKEAKSQGARGIILDVRQNPGGLLRETVEVADIFLDGGLVLIEMEGDGTRTDWTASSDGAALEIPLAVLVDAHSASGAEVLAGALQDRNRAQLVGTPTFGKGSVTRLNGLSDGSGLYVTFARWFTPDGDVIEGFGIEPDILVTFSEADLAAQRDVQLEAAVEHVISISG